jgi:hypothetical protein
VRGDLRLLAGGLAALVVGGVAAVVGVLAGADLVLMRLISPGVAVPAASVPVATFVAVPTAALVALFAREERIALDLLVGGFAAWFAAEALVGALVAWAATTNAPTGVLGYPATSVAILTVLAGVVGGVVSTAVRWAAWGFVAVAALLVVSANLQTPADVVGGVGLGIATVAGWRILVQRMVVAEEKRPA